MPPIPVNDFDGYCLIQRAAISSDGRAQLDLKDAAGAWDWRWCFSDAAHMREVLAVGLAAIATNRQIVCSIKGPLTANPTIGPPSGAIGLDGH